MPFPQSCVGVCRNLIESKYDVGALAWYWAHAPFWIYGSGTLRLTFAPSALKRRVTVDGRESLTLRKRGWHLVAVDIPHLREVPGETRKVGLKLLGVSISPSHAS